MSPSPDHPLAAGLAQPPLNPTAKWALIAGLVGLCCWLVSPAAIVLGRQALAELEGKERSERGVVHARVAVVLGWTGVGCLALFALVFLSIFLLNLLFGIGFAGIGAAAAGGA